MKGRIGESDPSSSSTNMPVSVRKRPWATLAVLTILYWFGTLDRQMSALLVTPIKQGLQLSDVQISLIHGLAFALLYMFANVPVGYLLERFARRTLLFVGALIWSSAAVASGLSNNFTQLFVARSMVGAGEAALQPTAFSMLADLFPPGRLSLPLSLFVLGGTLGSGMSFMLGGQIFEWIGRSNLISLPAFGTLAAWQIAFIVTGAPGLLLAFLMFTVPEPSRHATASGASYAELWRLYRRHPRFYIAHGLGFALTMSFVTGLGGWNAAFLGRAFGWNLGQIGVWLGGTQMAAGVIGLAVHGVLADRLYRRGRRDAHLRYFTLMCLIAAPLGIAAYQMDDAWKMLALYNLGYFCLMAYPGIGPAALQIATPPALRGRASAIYLVLINLVGMVLAPLVIAAITDYVFADESRLGDSMSVFAGCTTLMAAALFFWGCAPLNVPRNAPHLDGDPVNQAINN